MKSCIKLSGPSISEALDRLDTLLAGLNKGEGVETICGQKEIPIPVRIKGSTISAFKTGTTIIGDYDYVFEWYEKPTLDDVKELILIIDAALKPTGCRYTLTTTD